MSRGSSVTGLVFDGCVSEGSIIGGGRKADLYLISSDIRTSDVKIKRHDRSSGTGGSGCMLVFTDGSLVLP